MNTQPDTNLKVGDADPMIGRTLAGRFTIQGKLGAGSMGTVYRARQDAVGREVAIKILRGDRALDEQSKARFLREARANSVLTSPHTVTVFDFGESASGELFLAMEMLVGESVGQRLARVGRITPREAIEVVRQCLRSLAEAHAKGIIHRDLKPDNLFFASVESGSGAPEEVIKVLDFGIAKMLRDEDRALNAVETQAGTVFGTPRFMSPEQAQGKQLDARSDLYSLAVILYTMVSGSPPFTDDDAILVMARHIKTTPVALRTAAPDAAIPEALERIVMRVLSKNPNDRPENAEAFAYELSLVLEQLTAAESGVRSRSTASVRPLANASAGYIVGAPNETANLMQQPPMALHGLEGDDSNADNAAQVAPTAAGVAWRGPVLIGVLVGTLALLLLAIGVAIRARSRADAARMRMDTAQATVGANAGDPASRPLANGEATASPLNSVDPASTTAGSSKRGGDSTAGAEPALLTGAPAGTRAGSPAGALRPRGPATSATGSASAGGKTAAPKPSSTYESFEHL